jgi:hypothetical protein
MDKEKVREAMARGYCTKRNENKVLDANLIEDMAEEVMKLPSSGGMVYHKAKDGYKYFEKYTYCEHKKHNELGADCRECDIAWLIKRCEILEKIIEGGMVTMEEIAEIINREPFPIVGNKWEWANKLATAIHALITKGGK